VRVYRVEHSIYGSGPYVCADYSRVSHALRDFCSEIDVEHSFGETSATHPMPYADGIYDHYLDGWRSGFATLAHLRSWFSGWGARLDEHGFVVSKYGVPSESVVLGGHQVKFDIDAAEKITSVAVSSLVR
jgi:hypothetical protein